MGFKTDKSHVFPLIQMTKAEDGSFNLDWMMPPDTYIAGMSVRELGGWVRCDVH